MATEPAAPAVPQQPDPTPAPAHATDPSPAPAPDSGEPDDGFTAEERQQFNEMQQSDRADPASAEPAPVAAAPAVPGADADDDDDVEDEPAAHGAAPGAAPPDQNKQPKRVSYGKYRRTEDRAKKAETERDDARKAEQEARRVQAALDERIRIFNEALATPPPAADAKPADDDPMPDPTADIYGHIEWQNRQREKLEREIADVKAGRQQELSEQAVANAYFDDARALASKEPNFVPAYQHLMGVRLAQVALFYYGKDLSDPAAQLTPAEMERVREAVAADEKQLVANAIKSRQSPATLIFKMAKASGWRPDPAAAPAPAPAPNGSAAPAAARPAAPNGAAPAPAAPKVSVKDEIERIQNGQDAALSLSGGGGAPVSPMSALKLANMSQEDFNRYAESLSPDEWKVLAGGA